MLSLSFSNAFKIWDIVMHQPASMGPGIAGTLKGLCAMIWAMHCPELWIFWFHAETGRNNFIFTCQDLKRVFGTLTWMIFYSFSLWLNTIKFRIIEVILSQPRVTYTQYFKNCNILFAFFRVKSKYCWNNFIGVILPVDKEYGWAFCRNLEVMRSFGRKKVKS